METKDVTGVVVCIALILGMAWAAVYSLNKEEIRSCNNWRLMATQYQDFYLTRSQAEQCTHHGIMIDAPIGSPLLDRMAK